MWRFERYKRIWGYFNLQFDKVNGGNTQDEIVHDSEGEESEEGEESGEKGNEGEEGNENDDESDLDYY